MKEKLNTIQSLIGVLNSPIAQRKGVTISPEHCKIWVEELSKFMQEYSWHPASELPEKHTSKLGRVVILTLDGKLNFNYYVDGWDMSNVKWWCYLPKLK